MMHTAPPSRPCTGAEQSLASLIRDADGCCLVVHLTYLHVDAIVLVRHGETVELLFDGGGVANVFATTVAQRIDDSCRQAPLLRAALSHQRAHAAPAHVAVDAVTRRDPDALAVIRERLIAEHTAERIDRCQLNALLRTFDLPALDARSQVAFTITGTYLVDNDDTDAVHTDGHAHLSATFTGLDGFVRGSDVSTVVIESVTPAG